jgi:hypothetical protein
MITIGQAGTKVLFREFGVIEAGGSETECPNKFVDDGFVDAFGLK